MLSKFTGSDYCNGTVLTNATQMESDSIVVTVGKSKVCQGTDSDTGLAPYRGIILSVPDIRRVETLR